MSDARPPSGSLILYKVGVCPVCPDYVSVPVKIVVNDRIVVTSGDFQFYNCAATVRKNPKTP